MIPKQDESDEDVPSAPDQNVSTQKYPIPPTHVTTNTSSTVRNYSLDHTTTTPSLSPTLEISSTPSLSTILQEQPAPPELSIPDIHSTLPRRSGRIKKQAEFYDEQLLYGKK